MTYQIFTITDLACDLNFLKSTIPDVFSEFQRTLKNREMRCEISAIIYENATYL